LGHKHGEFCSFLASTKCLQPVTNNGLIISKYFLKSILVTRSSYAHHMIVRK